MLSIVFSPFANLSNRNRCEINITSDLLTYCLSKVAPSLLRRVTVILDVSPLIIKIEWRLETCSRWPFVSSCAQHHLPIAFIQSAPNIHKEDGLAFIVIKILFPKGLNATHCSLHSSFETTAKLVCPTGSCCF